MELEMEIQTFYTIHMHKLHRALCTVLFADTVQHSLNHGRNQVRSTDSFWTNVCMHKLRNTHLFFPSLIWSNILHIPIGSDNSIWSANDFRLFGFVIIYHFWNGQNGYPFDLFIVWHSFIIVCIPSMFVFKLILFISNNGKITKQNQIE